jgi:hypothetical protein
VSKQPEMSKFQMPAIHALALVFPEMSPEKFKDLKADIQANGLREKIVVYQEMILDGRHRAEALEQLGIDLDERNCEEFDPVVEGNALEYVVSRNFVRCHLTVGQRAAVAFSLAKELEKRTPKANVAGRFRSQRLATGTISIRMMNRQTSHNIQPTSR